MPDGFGKNTFTASLGTKTFRISLSRKWFSNTSSAVA
jgi:hypothetical protein